MDIYLKADGTRLRIPLLPDRLSAKAGSSSISYSIIKKGEYKIPRGTVLSQYSWNGLFPGKGMKDLPFIYDWQPPNRIVQLINEWINNNKILNLIVTETPINSDVFIEHFVWDHFGVDNVSYTLTLTQYRPIYVDTAPPQPAVTIPTATQGANKTKETKSKYHTDSSKSASTMSSEINIDRTPTPTISTPKTSTDTTTTPQRLSILIPGEDSYFGSKGAVVQPLEIFGPK